MELQFQGNDVLRISAFLNQVVGSQAREDHNATEKYPR
jgi:hypothetical protein